MLYASPEAPALPTWERYAVEPAVPSYLKQLKSCELRPIHDRSSALNISRVGHGHEETKRKAVNKGSPRTGEIDLRTGDSRIRSVDAQLYHGGFI